MLLQMTLDEIAVQTIEVQETQSAYPSIEHLESLLQVAEFSTNCYPGNRYFTKMLALITNNQHRQLWCEDWGHWVGSAMSYYYHKCLNAEAQEAAAGLICHWFFIPESN